MRDLYQHAASWAIIVVAVLSCGSATAQTRSNLDVKGLKAPVEILRDQWGVNHIYAANQHDLFFAQGYAAAKDRLFQFEVWRRQATGTVAEILGPDELKRDIGARLFKFRGNIKKELNHYHPQGEAIINAYVEGVNAYIGEVLQQPEKLPVEFRILQIKPAYWTPEVVISRHQGLLGNINEELSLGMAVAKAGEDKVKELMWFHPKEPQLQLDSAIRGDLLSKDILEIYNAYRRGITFEPGDISASVKDTTGMLNRLNLLQQNPYNQPFEHGLEGSNNWIVSGSRTASGHAMLANDPHRSIAVPSLRYMVHLVAPGWNVIGGGEPEIPGVSIGHNEHGAWGLTIYETDGEDLYVYDLNPANLKQYRHNGKWQTMTELHEAVPVKDAEPVDVTLRYTLHGPVTFIDSVNHKAYAVKGAWLEPGGAPYLASLRMNQAKNWEEFREACSYSYIPGENMIWADKKGNIGWQVVGIIPVRKHFSGMVPVPGDGRYEWSGYLPIKERPHMLNPGKGFFATANQNVTPDTYTRWNTVGYTWADPFRGNRINEVLEKDEKITMKEMMALQTDYFSIPARTLVPMLNAVAFDAALPQQAKAQLTNWNFVLDKQSTAAGIYAMWERKIMQEARNRFIPEELKGLVGLQLTRVISWLEKPEQKFGTEAGKDAFLRETFEMAVNELKERLGYSVEHWQYGQEKYKHVTLVNRLPGLVNAQWKEKVDIGPLPRGGNSHTPNSTGGYDNQSSGASFRMIVDVGDWDKAVMMNAPGQSGNPDSPYYKNLFELWANDSYFPAYYSKDKVEKVTKEETILQPYKKKVSK
ncbi:penicillin acylase family protein [Pontibacter diazotrophicus]|uniref:Penicillin acylase family protein n=1 Tax=Pontibacter diazotrophicus TaxID=1400979 RepID=A0A3D8LIM9_9BACT|nr:penicillin acylase family protein [Pontibacter diazotrophicus]RDV17176.1 penicillin acylase family protein [Pontibacter diazotrophicus]